MFMEAERGPKLDTVFKKGREKNYTRNYGTVRLLFSTLNNNVKHLRQVYIYNKSEFHLVSGV